MPAFGDLEPPLTGPGVALRAAAEHDIPDVLVAHQDDPDLARSLGLSRPPSGAELGRRVEQEAAERRAGTGAWLTILTGTGDERCRGQLRVHDVDPDHRRARLTLWIALGQRRRGLGSAALALAGRWLLTDCGLARVELHADPDDGPLAGVAARAGFQHEGVLRGHRRDPRSGARRDVAMLSLVTADLDREPR